MKVLVTGANGQLGYDVVKELQKQNIECYGTTRKNYDIVDFNATEKFITNYMPDAVIHCAAYTSVDKAEDERDVCYLVNIAGTENIAEVCKKINAKMLYVSTDYVFDGTKDGFYEVDDKPNPINVYGKTKLLGEQAVQRILDKYFIVRISWVFGEHGNNFVKTMLRLGKERKEISVVADQYGSPTYTANLAPLLVEMIQTDKYGVYHATNKGVCTWAEFAEEINAKLEEFFNSAKRESGTLDDGTEYSVITQQMAVSMDENGNITHTYVRTESYSISNAFPEAANDENAIDTLDLNPDENNTNSNSLIVKYGFAMYQSSVQIGGADSKELTEEEKNSNAMIAIGVQAVITIETSQVSGSEPATEIRKANGDVVELETGKLIQKHAGYSDGLQKYDAKA